MFFSRQKYIIQSKRTYNKNNQIVHQSLPKQTEIFKPVQKKVLVVY